MEILLIVETIMLILTVVYMIHEYSIKSISILIKLIVLISWIVCFSYLCIVPYDIYYVVFIFFN